MKMIEDLGVKKLKHFVYVLYFVIVIGVLSYEYFSFSTLFSNMTNGSVANFEEEFNNILIQKIIISIIIFLVIFYLFDSISRKTSKITNDILLTKKRFELAINSTNDGLWDWDIQTNEVFFSDKWKEMLGYSKNELKNDIETWRSRVHPDDIQNTYIDINAHLGGQLQSYENIHRVKHKEGHYLWILDRGKAIFENGIATRMIGFHTDITKVKELENNLTEILSLFASSDLVMFKCRNDEHWSVEYVSSNVTRLLGYSTQDFLSGSIKFADLIHPDYIEKIKKEVAYYMIDDIDEYVHTPYKLKKKNGEYIDVRDMTKFIRDSEGNIKYLSGYIIDITNEIKQDNDTFLEMKMSSLAELIGNISHQWRQPLSIISSAASGIKIQHEFNILDNNKLIEDMDSIVKYTKKLSNTLDNFTNFISSNNEKKLFFIDDTINIAINILSSHLIANFVTLDSNISKELQFFGFQNELVQVFTNLTTNSIDSFTQNEIDENNKFINIYSNKLTESTFELIYEDTAGGIKEDILNKIFEPYITTKHQSLDTGLGLFLCRRIVVGHFGGSIRVDNIIKTINEVELKGARFTIVLDNNI